MVIDVVGGSMNEVLGYLGLAMVAIAGFLCAWKSGERGNR